MDLAENPQITMGVAGDIQTIQCKLFDIFQTRFYSNPVDAIFKALGVE